MAVYTIRENGQRGTVDISENRLIRTRKRATGRGDIDTIPLKAVTAVSHARRMFGTDEVHVQVGSISYRWKVRNAKAMVDELDMRMF